MLKASVGYMLSIIYYLPQGYELWLYIIMAVK